ncbi:uncharacterized protein MEPE_06454 [Melanopsichium pennsylvanicum]|uniref:Fe/B12 periplasmic-binding domain-containing protein n=2 Tax=Melanopsichium pennsylvanicum TaxID=63383 RepID=A0AAJ4XR70_9BASI|nr:glycoside hydrolase family 115 protein [Melanopsichium pennsylvanicum 4]SNX87744.1 uncharacterized protein MEPE_06454 [Melanopsichium pennsylvanicum]
MQTLTMLWAFLALSLTTNNIFLPVSAQLNNTCLSFTSTTSSSYLLAKAGETTTILTSRDDATLIHHAASSFASDLMIMVPSSTVVVRNVTSASLRMQSSSSWNQDRIIIVGSISQSTLIRDLASMDKAVKNEMEIVESSWESWSSVITGGGLVMLGSDKRGAAYGLYTLSEELGVSPWSWFADVKPLSNHTEVYYSPPRSSSVEENFGSTSCSHGPPLVKYRGIFLNDEAPALTNWARTYFKGPFPPMSAPQSFNDAMYTHVFELLLRLKANLIWPAMWNDSFAVAGLPDLPNDGMNGTGAAGPNQLLADRMGIVFGTSHQEPMGRNTPEWNTWYQGPWDYTTNQENITTYWKYGVERAAGLDTMFTMSMRGNGDKALDGANIDLLQTIMAKQQSLLPKHQSSGKISVPQMMCLYTEVQGYYNEGLRVPDDITLLWTDDNFGFIRRIPTEQEKNERKGGAGLYYHADYVGQPRSYKWLNTVNLINTWEQLNVAFLNQQTEIFILNVGDLKPVEVPIHFTLNMAYDNTNLLHPSDVNAWMERWAAQTFGEEKAKEVAEVVQGYSWLNSRIKPELLNSTTWSVVNHFEAESVLSHWQRLTDLVENCLTPYFRSTPNWDAYYQLVAYPTLASANLNHLYVAAGKNNLASTQSKNSANSWANLARTLFRHDQHLTQQYHELSGGKWSHMMSQPHMGSQYWQQPMRNALPPLSYVEVQGEMWPNTALGSNLRVSVDASMGAWPGDNQYNCQDGYNCPDPSLMTLNRYDGNQNRRIWVSAGDDNPFSFTATSNATWLKVDHRLATLDSITTFSSDSVNNPGNMQRDLLRNAGERFFERNSDQSFYAGGNFDDEVEVNLSVDWSQLASTSCADAERNMVSGMVYINTTSMAAEQYVGMSALTNVTVTLTVDPCTLSNNSSSDVDSSTFVASSTDSSVSMLAEHATFEPSRNSSTYLETLPGYGLLGSAVTVLPPTADSIPAGSGPSLAFDYFIPATNGNNITGRSYAVNVTTWLAPILNYRDKRPLEYILELDNDPASRVTVTPVPENISPGTNSADWGNVVSANIRKVTTMLETHTTTTTTNMQGKHVVRWWPLEPGLVLEKVVVEPEGAMSILTSLGLPESRRVGMV